MIDVTVCLAIKSYSHLVVGRNLSDIFGDFASFWNEITQEPQLRWVIKSAVRCQNKIIDKQRKIKLYDCF